MSQRTVSHILTLTAFAFVSSTIAFAQSADLQEVVSIPIRSSGSWLAAQSIGSSKGKLFVVTLDQPHHRQTCRIQSFTLEKLVCSRVVGGPRTYLPEQIVALIVPGDGAFRLRLLLGLNVGMGAAIWGTVVLAATCPACAVGTGIAALILFGNAGVALFDDDQPDRLLYLAPGQHLTGKLGLVRP
jgi:hypothetical protein